MNKWDELKHGIDVLEISSPESDDYMSGFNDCRDQIIELMTPWPSEPSQDEQNTEVGRDEVMDVLNWADGVISDLGTEHSSKVTDFEAELAGVIQSIAAKHNYSW